MSSIAYISIGSNVGNRVDNCRRGISCLGDNVNSLILNVSRFYLTSPTDYEDQDWFVNAVVRMKTSLSPIDLLKELITIETDFGRKFDSIRFGPRKLDLDVIFYEDSVINSPDLRIPHPRMHERLFVLKPICDIAPDFIHPVFGVSMRFILNDLSKDSQKAILLNVSQNCETEN